MVSDIRYWSMLLQISINHTRVQQYNHTHVQRWYNDGIKSDAVHILICLIMVQPHASGNYSPMADVCRQMRQIMRKYLIIILEGVYVYTQICIRAYKHTRLRRMYQCASHYL